MTPEQIAWVARKRGLITSLEALDAGLSPPTIAYLVRRGTWIRMRRGVFIDAATWEAADPRREQHVLRAQAALRVMRRNWVLSHHSAAYALGLDVLNEPEPFVHITRAGHTNAWTKAGVKHHLARYHVSQVVEVEGVRSLNTARTVVDIARECGLQQGLVAADSAMRQGVPRVEMEAALAPMRSWPHVTQAREAVALADPGAQTVLESLARHLILELDLGEPDTQFPVVIGDQEYWCDIRVARHLVEVHGALKYRPRELGGVATTPAMEVLLAERKRERLLTSLGLGVTNLYWEDFFGDRREQTKARLLSDFEHTRQRWGLELPAHLAANAAAIRRRWGA